MKWLTQNDFEVLDVISLMLIVLFIFILFVIAFALGGG